MESLLEEQYTQRSKSSGLKVGDEVKVLKSAHDNEDGWQNSWVKSMDEAIGESFTISSISHTSGVSFRGRSCAFPFFVLEKKVNPYFTKKSKKEELLLL